MIRNNDNFIRYFSIHNDFSFKFKNPIRKLKLPIKNKISNEFSIKKVFHSKNFYSTPFIREVVSKKNIYIFKTVMLRILKMSNHNM